MNNRRRFRVAIGLHNLSTMSGRLVRTGIQEVVFQAFKTLLDFQHEQIDLIPILHLPSRNYSNALDYRPTHINPSPPVLRTTLAEVGISPEALGRRWPHLANLLRGETAEACLDQDFFTTLDQADAYFETSLCDLRHVSSSCRRHRPGLRLGQLVFDVVPLLFPEYADANMHAWFQYQYLLSLRQCHFTIAISRHTAIDSTAFLPEQGELGRNQYYCLLPTPERRDTPQAAVDGAHILAELTLRPTDRYILSVATLEPRKNLETIIRAFGRFRELFPLVARSVRLVLVGGSGWNNADLLRLLDEQGGPHIIRTGYVTESTLEVLIRQAACLIMPSHYEGFGLPVAQARFLGRPVITCINSSLPEAAALNEIFVAPGNLDEVALALARVFQETETDTGPPPLLPVTSHSWSEVLEHWCSIFAQVLTSTSSPPPAVLLPGPRRRALRLAIDCHNISIHDTELRKTGIQEVVVQLLASIAGARQRLGAEAELLPIPLLRPTRGRSYFIPTLAPRISQYEALAGEMGLDLRDFGPSFLAILAGDTSALESCLRACDWLLVTTQFCVEDLPNFQRLCRTPLRFSHLVFDTIPLKLPHFAHHTIVPWFAQKYIPSLQRWSSLCVCISRHSALDLAEALGNFCPVPIHWLRLPVCQPAATGNQDFLLPLSTPYFVVLGSTDPRKNTEQLLRGFQLFIRHLQSDPPVTLVLVGASGWENSHLASHLAPLQEQGRLLCPGYLDEGQLSSLLEHARGLLMPSRYEGFGLPLARALARGLPVLCCVNSSLPEVALAGPAVLVDPGNPWEIALGLARLLVTGERLRLIYPPEPVDWVDYLCTLVKLHQETLYGDR